jgi:hypothetical protein
MYSYNSIIWKPLFTHILPFTTCFRSKCIKGTMSLSNSINLMNMYDGVERVHKRRPCLLIILRYVFINCNPFLDNFIGRNYQCIWHNSISLFWEILALDILVDCLVYLRTPTIGKRRRDNILIIQPVIEDGNPWLPLSVTFFSFKTSLHVWIQHYIYHLFLFMLIVNKNTSLC